MNRRGQSDVTGQRPAFKDRTLGLVLFGILQTIHGGLLALGALLTLAQMAAGASHSATVARTAAGGAGFLPMAWMALFLLPEAVVLVWLGIGSIMTRRWARALTLASSWLWLITGLLGLVLVVPILLHAHHGVAASGRSLHSFDTATGVAAIALLFVFVVLLPALFIVFYGNRDVKATCEYRNPKTCWTDHCPVPVLAMLLLTAFWAISLLAQGFMNWTVPFFGTVLSGPTGAIVTLLTALLYAYAARGLYRRDEKAWRVLLSVLVAGAASTVLTFHRVGILGFYLRAGFSGQQLAPLRQLSAWPFALATLGAIAYVLYLRKYFASGLSAGRSGPAADARGWLPESARPAVRSGRRLLATRKARILAGTVVGALLLSGAIGYAVIERLNRDKRLADCERKGERRSVERNRCLAEAAQLWSKPEYCDGIESGQGVAADGRAECRSVLAVQLGNMELCERSGSSTATQRCRHAFAVRAEDPALCRQSLQGDAADACLQAIAGQAMRSELCSQVKRQAWREACLENFVWRGGDETACESITTPGEREECYRLCSTTRPAACAKLTADKRGSCLRQLPDLLDDLGAACEGSARCLFELENVGTAACALIPDGQAALRLRCFLDALKRRGAKTWIRDSECARLGTQRLRDECFFSLGHQPDHAGACLKISDAELRKQCLFAAGKRDASRCLALNDATDARRCVADSGLEDTIDASGCSLLPPEKRSQCTQRVSANLEREVSNAAR